MGCINWFGKYCYCDPDDANNNSIVADVHGDDEDAEEEGPSDNNNKFVTNPTSQHYGQHPDLKTSLPINILYQRNESWI